MTTITKTDLIRELGDEILARRAVSEALREIIEAYTDRVGRGRNHPGPIDEEIKRGCSVLSSVDSRP